MTEPKEPQRYAYYPEGLAKVDFGNYVKFYDYEKLQQELESVKAENEKFKDSFKRACDNLREQIPQAKKIVAELAAEKAKSEKLVEKGNELKQKLESFCGCNYGEQCDTCFQTDKWDEAIAEYKGEK